MLKPYLDYEPGDLTVKISELLVATSDGSDDLIDKAVPEVLKLMRDRLKMDVVFVSEIADGDLVIRYLQTNDADSHVRAGDAIPLEETWCQRVIDGRLDAYIADCNKNKNSAQLLKNLPFNIGTFMSTPIVLQDGSIYGTICCFSHTPVDSPDPQDLKRLKYTAQMTADMIDRNAREKS